MKNALCRMFRATLSGRQTLREVFGKDKSHGVKSNTRVDGLFIQV